MNRTIGGFQEELLKLVLKENFKLSPDLPNPAMIAAMQQRWLQLGTQGPLRNVQGLCTQYGLSIEEFTNVGKFRAHIKAAVEDYGKTL